MKVTQWRRKPIKQITLLLLGLAFFQGARAQSALHQLVPHHLKLQFAGGIGLASIGVGYTSRKDKVEYDLYYGYVPPLVGGVRIHSLSAKLTWAPVPLINLNKISVKPLTTGLVVNYNFGKQYFGFKPEFYPFNYYGYPTNIHLATFIGGAVDHKYIKRHTLKKIGLYYELITYDVELLSYVNNRRSLGLSDIFSLSLGIRSTF